MVPITGLPSLRGKQILYQSAPSVALPSHQQIYDAAQRDGRDTDQRPCPLGKVAHLAAAQVKQAVTHERQRHHSHGDMGDERKPTGCHTPTMPATGSRRQSLTTSLRASGQPPGVNSRGANSSTHTSLGLARRKTAVRPTSSG